MFFIIISYLQINFLDKAVAPSGQIVKNSSTYFFDFFLTLSIYTAYKAKH